MACRRRTVPVSLGMHVGIFWASLVMSTSSALAGAEAARLAVGQRQRATVSMGVPKMVLSLLKDLQHDAKEAISLSEHFSHWCREASTQHANWTRFLQDQLNGTTASRDRAEAGERKLRAELGAASASKTHSPEVNVSAEATAAAHATTRADFNHIRSVVEDALRLVKLEVRNALRSQLVDNSDERKMAFSADLVKKLTQLNSSAELSASEGGAVSSFLHGAQTLSSAEELLETLGGIKSRFRERAVVLQLAQQTEETDLELARQKRESEAENAAYASMVSRAKVAAIRVQLTQKVRERATLNRTIAEVSSLLKMVQSSSAAVGGACGKHAAEKAEVSRFIHDASDAIKKILKQQKAASIQAAEPPWFLQLKAEPSDEMADTLEDIEHMMADLPAGSGDSALVPGPKLRVNELEASTQGHRQGQHPGRPSRRKPTQTPATHARGVPQASRPASTALSGNTAGAPAEKQPAREELLNRTSPEAAALASLCAAVNRDLKTDATFIHTGAMGLPQLAAMANEALSELDQQMQLRDDMRRELDLVLKQYPKLTTDWDKYRKASARILGAHAKELVSLAADLLAEQATTGEIVGGLVQQLHDHILVLLGKAAKIPDGAPATPLTAVDSAGRALVQALEAGTRRDDEREAKLRAEGQFLSAVSRRQLGVTPGLLQLSNDSGVQCTQPAAAAQRAVGVLHGAAAAPQGAAAAPRLAAAAPAATAAPQLALAPGGANESLDDLVGAAEALVHADDDY